MEKLNFAIVSIFLILIILILGILIFEKSRPKAKDIVLVAELSCFSICARSIFVFVPYFNPVIALLCLWGFVFGAKKGFLIGILTAFGSNMIFGQGPWTLFQCVAWSIPGFVFGLIGKTRLFKKYFWSKKECFFAGFVVFVLVIFVVGPVMDLSSFLLGDVKNFSVLKTVLIAGFPFNLALALSSVLTIFLCANGIFKILKKSA